jgi:diaminopropionate ammonia-lyase
VSRPALTLHFNTYTHKPGPFPFVDAFPADGGRVALDAISSCPRYAVTPLIALRTAAARAGVGSVYYKDEAGRFGLGSFKALGGAYAVGRVLVEAVAAKLGQSVTVEQLARGDYAALTGGMRVVCASDGNHGRAVAAGARLSTAARRSSFTRA